MGKKGHKIDMQENLTNPIKRREKKNSLSISLFIFLLQPLVNAT